MPFKKGTSGTPIGSVSTTTKLIREHIGQFIAYLLEWEPSQFPSESFVLPHWHLPLLLKLNSIIIFFGFVEVEQVDKFIILIFIKIKKLKLLNKHNYMIFSNLYLE